MSDQFDEDADLTDEELEQEPPDDDGPQEAEDDGSGEVTFEDDDEGVEESDTPSVPPGVVEEQGLE